MLLIHDGTELDYTGLTSIATLGPIGNGSHRGYLCHNVLAVEAESGQTLGLAYQRLARRPKAPPKESRAACRARRDRESRMWKHASQQLPPAASGKLQVEVADRGADLLEFLDYIDAADKHYVVRSQHNRRICLENGAETKLLDFARQLPEGGRRTVHVAATAGRPAREATVSIAWSRTTLLIPVQPRGEIRGLPLTTWVICVREVEPPPGVEPLEWILVTNVAVRCWTDAQQRVDWYQRRWIIEEYHKCLKTGCQIEDLQLTTTDRLQPAIALLSVVAVFLLNLRDAGRRPDAQLRLAREFFSVSTVATLARWRFRQSRDDLTVHEFLYALARLGGHQNRKHDHPPGWLVLWRGWSQLQAMAASAEILDAKTCG